MVDKEKVVKALQCCTGDASRCDECPYDNKCLSEDETENTFFKDILEVINHYEEQVQKFEKVEQFATKTIEKQQAKIEKLENEKVLNSVRFFSSVKSEAIKEFAERFKCNASILCDKVTGLPCSYTISNYNFNRLVKEMTEQRKEDEKQ